MAHDKLSPAEGQALNSLEGTLFGVYDANRRWKAQRVAGDSHRLAGLIEAKQAACASGLWHETHTHDVGRVSASAAALH